MISRPALRYFGGKYILAPWIIEHFPKHRIYVEPFGGAMSVLLNKPRSYAEVYNDRCDEIVSFFRVLRDKDQSERLANHHLRLTPFSRIEFLEAKEKSSDPVENARRMIIRSFMGYGADSTMDAGISTGFRANSNRSGSTPAHDWINYPPAIQEIYERLQGVVIENRNYWEICQAHDTPETLHYLDPPYVHETRTKARQNKYNYEMTNDDHRLLLERIQTLQGMVVLSGYQTDVYDKLLWQRYSRKAFADGANKRVEYLWVNPKCMERQSQLKMF